MSESAKNGETMGLRVVVTFENNYHAYQDTLATAIRILRPDAQIMTVGPEEIGAATKRFGPDVVIGSPIKKADVENVPAWVELSLDPGRTSRVNVKGYYSEIVNPTLDKLMMIIEEIVPTNRKEALG
jgi:hypothetical protein